MTRRTNPVRHEHTQEVMQAIADYQAGRLGSIPAIHNAPTTMIEGNAPKSAPR